MYTLNSYKKLLSIGLFTLCYQVLPAAILPFHARISTPNSANPVSIGLPSATTLVQVTASWTGAFVDVAVQNKVTLGIDHQNMTFITLAGEIKVRIKLEQWAVNNTSNTPNTSTYQDLIIDYQPFNNSTTPYIDKSVFTFKGAYKFRITIDAITQKGVAINTLPANVFIDADITLERYHDFTSNSSLFVAFNPSATTDLNCDAIFDELEVSWLPMVGAEEYHLEWTFINDYGSSFAAGYLAPATLPYDFKHNSTRIATTSTSHKITLTFEHGYLLYRVRGIGRDLTDPQKNIVGVWNVADVGYVSSNTVHKYYNTQEHEANKNWQYSATYAEEGKKKEVISYFDGGLRNRQSVTKVNSDKNTIVGETIYDHQGRPAINVLPVPVNDPTCTNETPLKYYPNFNRNESKGIQSYSRIDFDLDIPGFCDTETGAMSIISGASNYYSAANPKKTGAQAFVPDGERFPFTQIEYTPDNTGRIRRQGGVGPKYQLGKNHETKYFYGWPNQIQLDRLFGSEVGDAAHYKKNLVVDANGQVSVSYLDQEGRTIATALAGNAPKGEDKTTTILAPLASESSAVKQLTIDLFAKNALGLSSVNTTNTAANAIVFNSQLLVAYESEYKFDYTLNIAQLTDTCLKAKVCFSCVYDLEIKITDDCGQPVTPMPGTGKQPINKTIGHFTTDTKGNIQYNRNCTGPTPFTHNESFTLNLPIGNYTISKILTVNSAARDFYVATYLDSLYNSCVKTLHDFQQEALAKIDTASCMVTCATCAKSLQTINKVYYPNVSEARDAYVAAGLGTELEFDYLLEECGAPCKTISWCEATYQQMLLDVSPDGQYAQFQPSIGGQAADWALSVLHLGNILPKSINEPDPNKLAHWKNPLIKVNGSNYEHYLEENGVRSIIHLTPNGAGNFIPAVDDPTQVKLDPVGNFHYTYPENLTNVQDFVNNWKGNWAKSLVQYHPEYCYYESCVEYSVPQTGYDLTSDGFDALLMVTNTYQDAANAGLILSSYPVSPPAQAANDIREMARFVYTSSPSTVKDPFYFSSGIAAVNNFQNLNSGPYSMVEVAAITARCGTNYGATPGQACKSFGKIVGTNAAENKRVLDLEWTLLKNFYLSEKRKVQQKLADAKALTTSCYGFNGCIGDTIYNPFASGMINISGGFSNSLVFNPKQPCSFFAAPFYARKKKRFIGPDDIHPPSSDEMDYQMYLQTGQCPLAIDLQYFITALASRDQLDNTAGENLQSYGEFTNDLYLALSGGTAPAAFIPYLWKATTTSGNILSGNFVNSTNNTPVCGLVLDKTGSGILNWDDIISISQLKYTSTVGTNYEFSAIAATLGSGGAIVYKPIRGSTCLKITGCIFPPQCDANELAKDLSALMSALQVNQELASSSPVDLSVPTKYLPFLTLAIKKALGTSNVTLRWRYTGNQYELFDVNNTTKMLVIKFTSFAPNTFNSGNLTASVKTFSGIESKYQNFFVVKGMNATNNAVVTINGSVELVNGSTRTGLSMGSCGLPQPLFCQGNEYRLRTDLEALLKDVLLKRPFTGNIDLTQSPYYSSLIQSYFPAGLNGTVSVNPHTEAYTDSLIFSIQSERGECPLLLHHEGVRPARYFSNLIGFDSPLMPYGPSSADNNYYRFYIVGIYQVGKTPLKDTIWGESCLPLKICDPCLDGPKLSCVSCDTLSIIPPDTLCQNKALVFRFASKGCNGVPELLWDFGDGTVSSLATHTYTKAGTYTVTLSTIRRPECRGLLTLVTNLKIVVKDCGQPKPLPLPKGRVVLSKVNRPLAPALNSQCEALYQQYVTAYRAFEIKQKIRRTCKEYKTTSPLYGYEDFVNNGLCNSTEGISLFQNYIQSFTLESPCPGAMPKALIPENPCKSAYNAYLTAINNYNEYIAGHPTIKLPKIVKIINYEEFIAGGFCYCVEGYTAFLQTIIDGTANLSGNREELYWQLDIANTCPPRLKPPCDPPMLQDTFVSPLYVPYTNPCVDYQINLAYTNAANAYQLYLDSLTTWIAAKYNEHCLKAFESFTARYDDKEYHFTLYYYDQAGNLVKTIPPEGVTLVTQAADFQQISKDRTFKQHTFFTDHTMATTYVYNSLNQLVRQSMPDHDLMDIWEYSLPNGLDPRLKVTATQFVNSTKGYLSGYIDMPSSSGAPAYTRGYLYTTDNGGTTWTKMNDLLAADLKKVQMLDAFKGFAVGKHGILLKTTDGASWDMVSSGVTTTLNDLYFTTASNGVIIGDNGVVLKTTDAGLNFSSIAPGFMTGMQLNAITYDGTSLYVGAKDANGQGKLYKGVVSNATTPAFAVSWSASNSIRSTDLVKVQMVAGSTTDGYAIGMDGTLLRTSNGGANWTTVPTGLSSNFKKVYFKTPAEGVAILEAVAGQGQIYKTTNSGASWTLISAAGEFYNDFYFYPNTSAGNPPEKGYAVSSDGKVKRIVMSGGYGLVNIVTTPFISSTDKLITVYFSDANRGWVASSTAAYYTSNANSSATTWTQVVIPSNISIKKLYFDQTAGSGMVLTNTGALYRIQASGAFVQMSSAGENYVDFDDNATEVYAFDKTSQRIKKALKSNLAAGLSPFGAPFPATAATNLVSINAQVSNTIYTAGSGGDLFTGSATAWTNNSAQVAPLAIYDVQAAGTNTIYAVGNEGTLLQTSNGSDWKTVPTATAVSLNALKFNTTATAPTPANYAGLIAGDKGLLLRSTVSAGQVALAPILVATSENLYDVALNTSNKAYVAGAKGTMVSIPNLALSTPLPVLAVQQSADDLWGLCFIPSSTAVYAVGDHAGLYQYNNSSGAKIKALYTPAFRDVHFTNVQNGYIVGDKGTIRYTADGGLNWQYVPFVNASGGTSVPALNGVWTTEPGKAVIIGNNKYLANATGTTVVYNNIGTGPNLYDVAIKNGKGYLVGANGIAYQTLNNGLTWTPLNGANPPSTALRAIHLFENNMFVAVGDQKKIYCYNGAWISHSAPASVNNSTVFTDVFFHDDRTGYVVGSGGPGVESTVLRCSFPKNIQSLGPTTNEWFVKPLTGVNGVINPLSVDVVTIDFATRYQGFLGGYFDAGSPSINYARLLNDETNLFSTRFFYDRLGRMVVSQNTKQFNRKNLSTQTNRSDFSYTLYDPLGRISEVGELSDNVVTSANFSTIFGEYVNQKFNPDVINDAKLMAWINASQRREVTKTYYDDTIITGLPIVQENLRKRVATVTYEDLDDKNPQTYQHATHYSYDIHGNVKTVLQDTPALSGVK